MKERREKNTETKGNNNMRRELLEKEQNKNGEMKIH
jgi:hypothetical protein